jgi:hypothetical protein
MTVTDGVTMEAFRLNHLEFIVAFYAVRDATNKKKHASTLDGEIDPFTIIVPWSNDDAF